MPRAEERTLPKGQPQGAVQEQQAFIQQTQPEAQPVSVNAPRQVQLPTEVPGSEPETPNLVGLDDGELNLDEVLFGQTMRPDEPVTAGIAGAPQAGRVTDVLERLLTQYNSADLAALAGLARALDV